MQHGIRRPVADGIHTRIQSTPTRNTHARAYAGICRRTHTCSHAAFYHFSWPLADGYVVLSSLGTGPDSRLINNNMPFLDDLYDFACVCVCVRVRPRGKTDNAATITLGNSFPLFLFSSSSFSGEFYLSFPSSVLGLK